MEQTALVSICIPCYNADRFIGETIQSVLAQTYRNLELIICDDCSVDNTVEVAKSFNDSRICIHINAQNLGSSANYNKSLLYANGKYAKLLCADDLLAPDCIEKQVCVFEDNKYKNLVMVTAEKRVINEFSKPFFVKKFPGKGGLYDGKKAVRKSVRYGTNIFGEPGLPMIKTETLRQTTGVIEDRYFTYCNDFDLWCKVLFTGNLYVIKETLLSFRVMSSSITSSIGWQQINVVIDYFMLLYKHKQHKISKLDLLIGKIMVYTMAFARYMFYKFM